MLLALRLKNLAIIDQLELSFAPGLTVISGETGAGKSILVGALALLLGAKGSADLVRAGCEEAEIEALFEAEGADLPEGLDLDPEAELLVRRTVPVSGRSRAWLNLRLCPAAVAADVCRSLVLISGQHEHQVLLRDSSLHLDILDRYAGLPPRRAEVAASFRSLTETRRALDEARRAAGSAAERGELLRLQAAEIEAAGLKPDEEEALEAERKVLRAADRLRHEAGEAQQLLDAGDASALSRLGVARRKLADLAALDARLAEVLSALEPALFQAEEAARLLSSYLDRLAPDPTRLEWLEDRVAAIRALKRRHRAASIEELLAGRDRALAELAALERTGETIAGLEAELARRRQECGRLSRELSAARAEGAKRLSAALSAELRQVGLAQAEFSVRLSEPRPAEEGDPLAFEGLRLTARGLEEAEFLVAPNPGEGAKPLANIASGGELSRVILGLKTVLSGGTETLVFDEVDAGLGGGVAEVVGRKLKRLSANQQVVCITHLPQIACFADRHLAVSKEVKDGRTLALVRLLSEPERLEEVARMLGGVRITDQARRHAREMMAQAAAP